MFDCVKMKSEEIVTHRHRRQCQERSPSGFFANHEVCRAIINLLDFHLLKLYRIIAYIFFLLKAHWIMYIWVTRTQVRKGMITVTIHFLNHGSA
uniref:Uncharacterized protein n=1 Tax=Octopus bimaculoides TaxID=37653 RepID=A0A0L8HGN4_OCTBM